MKIELHAVSKGRGGQALPETSLTYRTGTATVAFAETEQRPTVLGLIASGRMRPDTGRVTIADGEDAALLRRRVALIDAPDVNDPPPDVAVAGVVAEELMFAGLPATPLHARRWLKHIGYPELASVPIGAVATAARVRILCELAVLRDGVEGMVIVHPDRHGGRPESWWPVVQEFAERGMAMLVVVGGAAAATIERMPSSSPPAPSSSLPSSAPLGIDGAPTYVRDFDGASTTPRGVDGDEQEEEER